MAEARIAGAPVVDQRKVLYQRLGPDGYAAATASVSPRSRDLYDGAMTTSWVPVDAVTEVIEACAAYTGQGTLPFHTQVVRETTTATFTTIWRVLLRLTTDGAIVKRAPMIWRKMFDTGYVTATIAPGHGHIDLHDWPDIPEIHLLGFEVGSARILELAGRRAVRSERGRTPKGGTVDLYWRG